MRASNKQSITWIAETTAPARITLTDCVVFRLYGDRSPCLAASETQGDSNPSPMAMRKMVAVNRFEGIAVHCPLSGELAALPREGHSGNFAIHPCSSSGNKCW